ncbi:hypothetical protein GOODEAATRI_013270 [Goodea atripinnis]|uniref:Ig-like domain-containing protein n=1 Tax=Goodea atripinnis TaxID=208336 RepID=A0ABV0PDT9_9TELE
MDPRGWSVWLKVDVLLLIAIQLRTGPQTIQKAEGETVNLGCTYTPGAEDKGDLDIEWSRVSPDMTQKDKLILSYTVDQIHYYDPDLSKRINLLTDPKQGDASISISAVRASDTGTYQCKIKKAPGVDMRKVTLVVLGKEDLAFNRFYLFIVS